jgi:hypothetical protein
MNDSLITFVIDCVITEIKDALKWCEIDTVSRNKLTQTVTLPGALQRNVESSGGGQT